MKLARITLCVAFVTMGVHAHAAQNYTGFYDNSKGSPVVDLINQAKNSIELEIYEMDDPNVIAAIRQALHRRVSVHIVKEPDPVGAPCKVFGTDSIPIADDRGVAGGATCTEQRKLVGDVIHSGGKYVPFTKPDLCGDQNPNCLEHGKILIIDAKQALITTGNFNTTNLCDLAYSPKTCNRDYSYVTADQDIVQTLQKVIELDLRGQSYNVDQAFTPGAIKKLTVGPNSLAPLVDFIKTAKYKIKIENQYLKEPTINQALMDAAKQGVEVDVVVASACSFGQPKAAEAKKLAEIFSGFDRAGIKTKMFNKNILINGRSGYLHAKAILVDDTKAWIGSVNGSTQATTINREFGVFFNDAAEIAKISDVMDADIQDPNEESWQASLNCAEGL